MIMKPLLSLLFLSTALSCAAQYHNVEGIRVVGRSDSTTISNVGQIQFDADDDKFRFNDGTGWFSFLKEGASLPYLPLITGGNNFDVEGTGTLRFGNPDLLDGALSGIWLQINNNGGFVDDVSVQSQVGEIVNISSDVTLIKGRGNHEVFLGSSGSRLDDLFVYADASVSFNVASGNNLNTATLTPNSYSLIMYDTDGETIDLQIDISTGTSDIIRIAKDGSLVFSIDENGHIIYVNPPTDCDGLDTNTIWSDSGTLKLCP